MKRHSFLRIVFFLVLGLSSVKILLAAEASDVPENTTASVIEAGITRTAKQTVNETAIPDSLSFEPEERREIAKEGQRFRVEEIRLQPFGNMSDEELASYLDLASLKPLLTQYEKRDVSLGELAELQDKIEWMYRAKGYFAFTRLPEQDVDHGILVLEILFSRMGKLTLDGSRYSWKKRTLSYWKIKPGEVLRYDKIAESIYAMGANPDRTVKPLLKPGAEMGSTDVVLKAYEKFPLHGRFSFDNAGAKLTGKERFGFTLRHNNLLFLDDTFVTGTVFGETFGAFFLQHRVPLTSFGTSLNYGFTHAQVSPKKEFKEFGINGMSETYSLGLRQDLLKTGRILLAARLGFDFKEKRTRVLSTTSVWDRLRVLDSGMDLSFRDPWGVNQISHDLYAGLPLHGDGYPLTTRQAASKFLKYEIKAERRQRSFFSGEIIARVQAQLSTDKLVPQEELFMGGADTVRGYPEGDYGADQGTVSNFEYQQPLIWLPAGWKFPFDPKPLRENLKLLAFADHGYGRLRDPSENERRTRNLLGVGGGAEWRFRSLAVFRLEWAAPLGDEPITESGKSQVHFKMFFEL